jgi:hypothetical protein
MSLIHFRCKERRRTVRVALSVPLVVHGQSETGEKFAVRVRSLAVNRSGALLQMDEVVVPGQMLLIMNEELRHSIECRVASIHRTRDGKTHVGVEFTSADGNFWHMTFPAPGTRPLRRSYPSKVIA